jgi:hypothetical protein
MGFATVGLALVPLVSVAILLSAADRGLNYSLQQATKETLYVPLSDAQKYKGKAVIDMFVDRLGKAVSAIALIGATTVVGLSIPVLLAIALGAIVIWVFCADRLGRVYLSLGICCKLEKAEPRASLTWRTQRGFQPKNGRNRPDPRCRYWIATTHLGRTAISNSTKKRIHLKLATPCTPFMRQPAHISPSSGIKLRADRL